MVVVNSNSTNPQKLYTMKALFKMLFGRFIKDTEPKVLNTWLASQTPPATTVEKMKGIIATKGDVKIQIGDFIYRYFSPFRKISEYPRKDESFFQYLAKDKRDPVLKNVSKWLEKDMQVSDPQEDYRFSILEDLRTDDNSARLKIGQITNSGFCLLVVIETPLDKFRAKKRTLIEVVTLIKTLAKHERDNWVNYELLDAFGYLQHPETLVHAISKGKSTAYCFLQK